MVASASLARVTRVLVLRRDRLDKADRIEVANIAGRVRKLEEFLFVAQVRSTCRTRCKRCVVIECIVVELELLVRAEWISRVRGRVWIRTCRTVTVRPTGRADISVRVRPPARVPSPTDVCRAEFVTDRNARLWR